MQEPHSPLPATKSKLPALLALRAECAAGIADSGASQALQALEDSPESTDATRRDAAALGRWLDAFQHTLAALPALTWAQYHIMTSIAAGRGPRCDDRTILAALRVADALVSAGMICRTDPDLASVLLPPDAWTVTVQGRGMMRLYAEARDIGNPGRAGRAAVKGTPFARWIHTGPDGSRRPISCRSPAVARRMRVLVSGSRNWKETTWRFPEATRAGAPDSRTIDECLALRCVAVGAWTLPA